MKVGDYIHAGIYAGIHDGNHIICSLKEYEAPVLLDWQQAVEYCQELGMALPTIEELNLLYELSKISPGQFRSGKMSWYWSSTESSSTAACFQYFGGGSQYDYTRTSSFNARAVQRIKI